MGKRKSEELLKKIALRIRELRELKGITQEDFFNDTGIHIGRIETVQRNLNVSTLQDICNYLEINISDFFKGI